MKFHIWLWTRSNMSASAARESFSCRGASHREAQVGLKVDVWLAWSTERSCHARSRGKDMMELGHAVPYVIFHYGRPYLRPRRSQRAAASSSSVSRGSHGLCYIFGPVTVGHDVSKLTVSCLTVLLNPHISKTDLLSLAKRTQYRATKSRRHRQKKKGTLLEVPRPSSQCRSLRAAHWPGCEIDRIEGVRGTCISLVSAAQAVLLLDGALALLPAFCASSTCRRSAGWWIFGQQGRTSSDG